MMTYHLDQPHTDTIPAVITIDQHRQVNEASRLTVHSRLGVLAAWSWLDLPTIGRDQTLTGLAKILPMPGADDFHVMVGFHGNPDMALKNVLCQNICPVPGVVRAVSDMVERMQSLPLRRFVKRALLCPDTLIHFWSCPASGTHHHAYPGGLAEHSLEVARDVECLDKTKRDQRDLGIAFGLLHDYGKVWQYTPQLAGSSNARRHEIIGLQRLATPLRTLACEAPDSAALMTELLGGPPASRKKTYPLAMRALVAGLDQLSCENERRRRSAAENVPATAVRDPFWP